MHTHTRHTDKIGSSSCNKDVFTTSSVASTIKWATLFEYQNAIHVHVIVINSFVNVLFLTEVGTLALGCSV